MAAVALGIALGFFAVGSPEKTRQRAFDLERARQLGELSHCIEGYARDFGELPPSLDALRQTSRFAHCSNVMQDPETRARHEYRITLAVRQQGPARVGEFELCASFALPSSGKDEEAGHYGSPDTLWLEHPAGRGCQTMTAPLGERKRATPPVE